MLRSVKSLDDIPELFVTKGENEMGWTRKNTPEKLDKIIQFIWDYQDKHNGDTPNVSVIGRHVGIDPTGMGYWITMLVDQGRLDKISSRPFRATITPNPKNASAIDRFKRIRERIAQSEAEERDRVRAEQDEQRQREQTLENRNAALSLSEPAVLSETVTAEVVHDDRVQPDDRLFKFTDAHARVREVNREVKALMPKLLRVADERDLVFELLTRGYRVDKVR